MMVLTIAFALVPIAIGGNKRGREIEHPMAIVIIGALVTSTLLNFLITPTLYWKFAYTF